MTLTREQLNSNLQMTNDVTVTINYCDAMNHVHVIVHTAQVHRCPAKQHKIYIYIRKQITLNPRVNVDTFKK